MKYYPGAKFNRLTFIEFLHDLKKWKCVCDCGNVKIIKAVYVGSGNTKSCGCLKKEAAARNSRLSITHNMTGTGTHASWQAMLNRCLHPISQKYKDYGAVGILPCKFIKESPVNLLKIVGPRPEKHTLDRINGKLGYYCGQCEECLQNGWPKNIRWLTNRQQCRNRKTNRSVTINGETKLAIEWSESIGISKNDFLYRLRKGWSSEKLLQKIK